MTLRHLNIFVAVAETGSMSRAAEQLYIAQPSVSQAISELERHYGCKLFERLSRRLYITETGQRLLGYARHILSLCGEMERQALRSADSLRLRLGATITVGTCVLCDLIAEMRREMPAADAVVQVANTAEIESRLLQSELDAALVEGRVHSGELIARPVIEDELALVTAPEHPFAGVESVDLETLSEEPLILREPGSGTRELLAVQLAERGLPMRESWTCSNSEAIKNAVRAGMGVTVISRRLVQRELDAGLLVETRLSDCSLRRAFSLVYHRDKYLGEAMRLFIGCCERFSPSV